MKSAAADRGFTLLELVVAMTIFSLVALSVYGVLVLGARSAGSGERVSEQARRYRLATELVARQLAAAEPIELPEPDGAGLGDDDEGADVLPYFYGDEAEVTFVTTAPQRPDASGLAVVHYWLEEGMLRMAETPVFSMYGADRGGLGRSSEDEDTVEATLLYDVDELAFSYLREGDTDDWLDSWDASEENLLPACVRLQVASGAIGGPNFYHEMPVLVGTFNQISGQTDFKGRKFKVQNDDALLGGEPVPGNSAGSGFDDDDDDDATGDTLPDDDDDDDDDDD